MKIKTEFLLPVMLLFSSSSHAFDWLFEPDFDTSERYTDNLRMQIRPTRDNFITTLSPNVLLGYIAENHELKSTFKWNELIYHGESDLDFSEKIANLNHLFTGEHFKTDLSAQYAEQSSINTQLDIDGTGNLQIQIPRTTRSITPSFTYNLTETDAVQLSYNYTDVAYARQTGLNVNRFYSDYTNQQYSGTFTHVFSERFSVNLTGAYAKFSTSGVNPSTLGFDPRFGFISTESDYTQSSSTITYQAGFQYSYDELTRFSFSAGMRDTDTNSITNQTFDFLSIALPNQVNQFEQNFKTSGRVFSASLNRKFERGNLDLSAGQQLSPASTGGQRNTTNFSANAKYNLDERWTAGLDASYLLSEQLSNNGTSINFNRTYITLTPNINWRWTEEVNLGLSYSYRYQKFSTVTDAALGNNVQLQFSYQPQINRQVK